MECYCDDFILMGWSEVKTNWRVLKVNVIAFIAIVLIQC
jgi:hypothetical protein